MPTYDSDIHQDINHFVLDMEAHGVARRVMPFLFHKVKTMDGKTMELVSFDHKTNEVITCRVN